jgi:hypothetical protein
LMAQDKPAGPPPTITTSYSIDSRSIDAPKICEFLKKHYNYSP